MKSNLDKYTRLINAQQDYSQVTLARKTSDVSEAYSVNTKCPFLPVK